MFKKSWLFVAVLLLIAARRGAGETVTDEQLSRLPVAATLFSATDSMREAEDNEEPELWRAAARLYQMALLRTDATAEERAKAAYGLCACLLEGFGRCPLSTFEKFVPADNLVLRGDLAARLLKRGDALNCLKVLGGMDVAANPDALILKATAMSAAGDPRQAHELFVQFADMHAADRRVASAEYSAARTALLLEDFPAAETWFARSAGKQIEGVSRFDQELGMANACFGQQKFDQAAPLFKKLSEADFEQAAYCRLRYAQCLAGKNDFKGALAVIGQVTEGDLQIEAQFLALKWRISDGQPLGPSEKAIPGAEPLLLIDSFREAEEKLQEGEHAASAVAYEEIAAHPAAPLRLLEASLFRAAQCRLEVGDGEAARRHLSRLFEKFPATTHLSPARFLEALALTRLKQFPAAQAALHEATATAPNAATRRRYLLQAGRDFEIANAFEFAAVAYERIVLDDDPAAERTVEELLTAVASAVRVRDRQGAYAKSIALLERAARALRGPADKAARRELILQIGERYEQLGQYSAAIKRFRSLARDPAVAPRALLQIGQAFEKAGRTDRAAEAYYELATRYPVVEPARAARGRLEAYLRSN